jgi:23S rRNA G2069 N7-methylase RlmK/C1962 C5-methylase RlmI
MLANRVRKNHKHLARAMARKGVDVYRLYDRDIPEIRVVVDYYAGHLVVGEYARTQTDVEGYLESMAAAAARGAGVPAENVHVRKRQTRPAAGPRYGKLASTASRLEVHEGGLRFLVNLDDYLDTGLFADHRETRARVRGEVAGKRFLNLYAYTGAFTVYAAAGGARESTSVDASGVYLDWARENLKLNGLDGPQHQLVREDVEDWLRGAERGRARWDVAFVDPPSFSDRGAGLDVQRDHRQLVERTIALVAPGGLVYFSTNHQRFEPSLHELAGARECREITHETVPEDYRNKAIHRCWRIVVG